MLISPLMIRSRPKDDNSLDGLTIIRSFTTDRPLKTRISEPLLAVTLDEMYDIFDIGEWTYRGWRVTGIAAETLDSYVLHLRKGPLCKVVSTPASSEVLRHKEISGHD